MRLSSPSDIAAAPLRQERPEAAAPASAFSALRLSAAERLLAASAAVAALWAAVFWAMR